MVFDPATLSAIGEFVGGAGSLAGALGLGGGGVSNKDRTRAAAESYKMDYNWTLNKARDMPSALVQGAKKAGIHPLVAMGMSPSGGATLMQPNDQAGVDLAQAGQGFQRAAGALATRDQRALEEVSARLSVENQELQNEFVRTQIQHMKSAGTPPSFALNSPMEGQTDAAKGFDTLVQDDSSLTRSSSGRYAVVPSQSVKQNIEDMLIPEVQWYLRQIFGKSPDGYTYNPITGELHPDSDYPTDVLGMLFDNIPQLIPYSLYRKFKKKGG